MGGLVPAGDPAGRAALRGLPETRGHPMSSSEFRHYNRDEFLAEFYPDPDDKAAIAAGMEQLRAEQRAYRLAEMRRRLGITKAQVAARMGITQGRVSAIEHAKPGTTELRTLAAYVEALGGRLEIIADFGDQRLAFTELSASNLGSSLCAPALACNVFSFEAKAPNSARPAWRSMCSSSHWRSNSTGMVIWRAAAARASGQWRPKTAAVIRGSAAVNGTPIAVPMFRPQ